jgi:hypothetical protein
VGNRRGRSKSFLVMQGYSGLGNEALARLNLPLRFSPALCLAGTVAGTVTRSWPLFAVLAIVALIGWLFPGGHPFDLVFNRLVRHALRGDPLPPNPAPRRSAFLMAVPFLGGAAVCFRLGADPLGYALAAFQLAGCATYVFTGLCLASWLYGMTVGRRISRGALESVRES